MKRALVATGIAALLLLTGCTSTTTAETVTVTPGAEGTYSDGGTTVEVQPTEAPATPVEVSATPPANREATSVLTGIQLAMSSYGLNVNAEQIKTASDYACDQLANGATQDSIVALTGDIPEQANLDLVQLAADEYCPVR
ncbi:hypothetical protein AB0230_01790 [Microbacterium sp. NPDC089190]|uniref:hypothetical protein n=1 Tax=Microbacterium sp. NPDC089190 TaxID=3155063 RepID=UPI00344EC459